MNSDPVTRKPGARPGGKSVAHPAWLDQLAAEEALVLLLSRPRKLFDSVADVVRELLERAVDWDRILDLSSRHVVFPLVYRNLRNLDGAPVDKSATARLEELYHASHRNGLLLSHSLFDLQKHFDKQGIDVLVHKGVVVGSCYYGEVADRMFGDLDLFVRREDVPRTALLLNNLGFRNVDEVPHPVEDHWRTYRLWEHPHGNAVGFVKRFDRGGQVDVDLQWGLAPHYFTLDLSPEPMWERARTVSILDHDVRTFSAPDTMLMLCIHGAKHVWTEIRQISDIGAFLSSQPDLDWDAVLRMGETGSCTRIVLLGARLGSDVMGADLPVEISRKAHSPEIDDLFRRIVKWRFRERRGRISRFRQRIAFNQRARDRRADSVGTIFYEMRLALGLT